MADDAEGRQLHEADREALVEATNEALAVYADLTYGYDHAIVRRNELLKTVDDTLRKVRQILASG